MFLFGKKLITMLLILLQMLRHCWLSWKPSVWYCKQEEGAVTVCTTPCEIYKIEWQVLWWYNCKMLRTVLSTSTTAMKLLCSIHLSFSLLSAHCVLFCPKILLVVSQKLAKILLENQHSQTCQCLKGHQLWAGLIITWWVLCSMTEKDADTSW